MKYIILTLLSINLVFADWIDEEDYSYKTTCFEFDRIVFFYHGANYTEKSTPLHTIPGWEKVIESELDRCSLVVLPKANVYNGVQTFDFTGELSYNADIARLLSLIALADIFTDTIYLVGGSAGGFTAYRLAVEAKNIGIDIAAIVTADSASPYGVSTFKEPPRYRGLSYEELHSFKEFTYFYSGSIEANTGLYSIWDIPMLSVNSADDPIVPLLTKKLFVHDLEYFLPNLEAYTIGTGHDIGEEGLDRVTSWLKLQQ